MDAEVRSLVYLALGKWFTYLGLVGLTGAVCLRQLLGSVGIEPRVYPTVERLLVSLASYANGLVIVAVVARLYAQTFSVFGLDEPVTLELLRVVGFESRWGRQWLLHAAVTILAGMATMMVRSRVRLGWNALAVLTVVLWLTLPLTGHAMSFSDPSFFWAIQVSHGLAAGAWIGTLFALFLVGSFLCESDPRSGSVCFAVLVRRFSPLAVIAVMVLFTTGTITSWFYLGSFERLWSDSYGKTLLLKLFFVISTGAVGFYNWRFLAPRLGDAAGSRRLFSSIRAELVCGLLLLAATAVLVHLAIPTEMG